MDPLTVLEVLWTLGAIIGCCVSAYNLFDVLTDLKVLSRSNLNGLRLMVARGNIRGETVRLFTLLSFGGIGVIALLIPNPVENHFDLLSWALRLGLIAINGAIVYNTIADRILRHNIFNYAESMEQRAFRHREKDVVAKEGERRVSRFDRRQANRAKEQAGVMHDPVMPTDEDE